MFSEKQFSKSLFYGTSAYCLAVCLTFDFWNPEGHLNTAADSALPAAPSCDLSSFILRIASLIPGWWSTRSQHSLQKIGSRLILRPGRGGQRTGVWSTLLLLVNRRGGSTSGPDLLLHLAGHHEAVGLLVYGLAAIVPREGPLDGGKVAPPGLSGLEPAVAGPVLLSGGIIVTARNSINTNSRLVFNNLPPHINPDIALVLPEHIQSLIEGHFQGGNIVDLSDLVAHPHACPLGQSSC